MSYDRRQALRCVKDGRVDDEELLRLLAYSPYYTVRGTYMKHTGQGDVCYCPLLQVLLAAEANEPAALADGQEIEDEAVHAWLVEAGIDLSYSYFTAWLTGYDDGSFFFDSASDILRALYQEGYEDGKRFRLALEA